MSASTSIACPACGQQASVGPQPPSVGSEQARRFQFSRPAARYFTCPAHGGFSIREETIDGQHTDVAVIDSTTTPDYWIVG